MHEFQVVITRRCYKIWYMGPLRRWHAYLLKDNGSAKFIAKCIVLITKNERVLLGTGSGNRGGRRSAAGLGAFDAIPVFTITVARVGLNLDIYPLEGGGRHLGRVVELTKNIGLT